MTAPPKIPTMYFIGVSTSQSSSARMFPAWAEILGLGECALVGLDFKVRDEPRRFREVVEFIKSQPLALGALVTTHKMDLFAAARDCFDELDSLAAEMGEVSSIFKRDGRLCGKTSDPYAGGLALEAFLPAERWSRQPEAEVLVLGAGGSALALVWHLLQAEASANTIHVANRSAPRLEHLRTMADRWGGEERVKTHLAPGSDQSDALLAALPPGSMVVNATGLGKDAPGSPLSDAASFPEDGIVWEFNYRGELVFLEQAKRQQEARDLLIEDGWRYFVIGWSQVVGDVFDVEIPTSGGRFDELSRAAAAVR